jgi:Fe-S cluster assembly protein SufD
MTQVASANDYLDALLQGRKVLPEAGGAWLRALRSRAVERANALTVPSTRDEEWRFTDLSPLYKMAFSPSVRPASVEQSQVAAFAIPEAGAQLVFVDGRYSEALSRTGPLEGVNVCNLADAVGPAQTAAEAILAKLASIDDDAFAAVNTAFLRDGAMVQLTHGRALNEPIHLLFIATSKDSANYPRVVVMAETGAHCTIIEEYVTLTQGAYLTDAVSEVFVAENASVSHVRLQRENQSAFHIGTTAVKVLRGGRYAAWAIALGARISRHNLSILQAGEATEFSVDGLAVIGGRQLADTHSTIDHAHAHGRSNQMHKTVVGGGAHAVFNGKILVRAGAQQTDSGQQSRNLLISDKARVDTKPQLEIFADDVKCAHGATVGQIEADELFYLKSRGLSDAVARNLLTYAFAAQVIERVPVPSLVRKLEEILLAQTQTREPA